MGNVARIYATTDYINEGLKHPRKDNIIDFVRGKILLDVSGTQYEAGVVIGFTKSGICELHDIVQMTPTSFEYKKDAIPESMDSDTESTRSGMTSSGSTQTSEAVSPIDTDYGMDDFNNSISQNSEMSSDLEKIASINQLDFIYYSTFVSGLQDCEGKLKRKYVVQLFWEMLHEYSILYYNTKEIYFENSDGV